MGLSDVEVRKAKPRDKRYMLSDGYGLNVEIWPSGTKVWRLRYWRGGKEMRVKLGNYPAMTLHDARVKAHELKQAHKNGEDIREVVKPKEKPTFEAIGRDWYANREASGRATQEDKHRLEGWLYPLIGSVPIADLSARALLEAIRKIEATGKIETAVRCKSVAGQVMRFGVLKGACVTDVTPLLRGQTMTARRRKMPALTDEADIRRLLRAMRGYGANPGCSFIVECALWFSFWTAARPGEIARARWDEIDLAAALWRIPSERMKMKRPHICPLPTQAVEMLKQLAPFTGRFGWLFASSHKDENGKYKPLSNNTVGKALRVMGFQRGTMCAHGFRSIFSTVANENGFRYDVIEMQLAHLDTNAVRAAYNRAEYLQERREMVQWWADWGGRMSEACVT